MAPRSSSAPHLPQFLHASKTSSNAARETGSAVAVQSGANVVHVPAITLRQIVERNRLARFTLVSDIEGAECDLLREEGDLIRERCGTLIIELHETTRSARRFSVEGLAAMIGELGFTQRFRRNNVFVFQSPVAAT